MALDNFSFVDTSPAGFSLYRSAQPKDEVSFETIKALNIKYIYKINSENEFKSSKEAKLSGCQVQQDEISQFDPQDEKVEIAVEQLRELLKNGNVLVHCLFGRDRTGLLIGAYRLFINDWPLEKAMKEREQFDVDFLVSLTDNKIVFCLERLAGKASTR